MWKGASLPKVDCQCDHCAGGAGIRGAGGMCGRVMAPCPTLSFLLHLQPSAWDEGVIFKNPVKCDFDGQGAAKFGWGEVCS